MTTLRRIGDFLLGWGESLHWDDRRERLYFVDCAARTLHWLEGTMPPLHTLQLHGLPTGMVLTEGGLLVVALDEGLYVIDPDTGTTELLTSYPEGLGPRANDVGADLDGNLITGTLNLAPGPGSCWWYSSQHGWRELGGGISNVNGPVVLDIEGESTLVVADTHAGLLYAYPYDGSIGTTGEPRVFADTTEVGGMPDGACVDERGGVWSCILAGGRIVRYTADGVQLSLDVAVEQPSDVVFGGANLDAMFYVSVKLPVTGREIQSSHAGALMAAEGTGFRGRPEPRFVL